LKTLSSPLSPGFSTFAFGYEFSLFAKVDADFGLLPAKLVVGALLLLSLGAYDFYPCKI